MIQAREKADELYDKFFDTEIADITKAHKKAKEYALITIKEILKVTVVYDQIIYWNNVKAHLDKI